MSKLFPTKKDAYRQGMERGVDLGIDQGVSLERERILTQWQYEMFECECEQPFVHMERRIKAELSLIKGQ